MPQGLRLGVLASGRGTDLQSLIDAREQARIQSRVAVVISDNPDAKALERAKKHAIPVEALQPSSRVAREERKLEHESRMRKVLNHFQVDLVVLAGYMRLVSSDFVRAYPNRMVNIHPGLLPSFPGLNAQKQALEWGVRIAGCTTHFVDEKTDHGPIILQAAVPVQPDDEEETLSKRILEAEHQILPRTVHLVEQGRVKVEGRRVLLAPDESWAQKYPMIPGVFYGPGY